MSKDATEIYDVVPIFAVDETGKALITEEQYSWLCNYAVRKAEQVQELEETNKKNYWIAADLKFENLKLEQQNKRYREALNRIKATTKGGIGMSKERLEEHTHVAISIPEYQEYKELKKRVQELEKASDEWILAESASQIEFLTKRNKRYREALEHCKDILKENREINKNEYSSYITGLQEGLEFAIDEFEKVLESESK